MQETEASEKVLLSSRIAHYFPKANQILFASFNNKFSGRNCYIVGRGPTKFEHEKLSLIKDPIFFINDAVLLEKYASGETFFFAHGRKMIPLLQRVVKSVAVLVIDGTFFVKDSQIIRNYSGDIVGYHWHKIGKAELLKMSRDEIAKNNELYTHSGTIHSVLHFIWYCGFQNIFLIGCDGINNKVFLKTFFKSKDGYDPRLENISRTNPWWNYRTIRHVQNRLIKIFELNPVYLGTPDRF